MSTRAFTIQIFRSSGKFVTGNNDGSVSLFKGAKLQTTKKLGGTAVHVGYFNGQIVAAARNGKVTIMNEYFGIVKEFAGSTTSTEIRSVCGNSNYFAICDSSGSVQYYKRDFDVEPKVIFLNFQSFKTYLRFTSIMIER